jgi:EAL domain-containing protein (putative c-di-GMP-specific phosphodiesterase class I)
MPTKPATSNPSLRYVGLAFAGADLAFEIDLKGTVVFALGAAKRLTGRAEAELVGHSWSEIFAPREAGFLEAMLEGLPKDGRRGPLRVTLARTDGLAAPHAMLSLFRSQGLGPGVSCALSLGSSLALADTPRNASGLVDRDDFNSAVAPVMEEAQRAGIPLHLEIVDLVGFAAKLSKLDDAAAETERRAVAGLLRSESFGDLGPSEIDTDRFALVRQDAASDEGMLKRLRTVSGVNPSTAKMTLSGSAAENVRAIRYALDRCLEEGARGKKMDFSAIMERTVREAAQFKAKIAQDAFVLVYQPVVNLGDSSLHHFEALARFGSDDSPAETIKLAEDLDMIADFDLAVVKAVLARLATEPEDTKIAANVSARSMSKPAFLVELARMITKANPRMRLLLEITETHEIADFEPVAKALNVFRGQGYKICLDDFGAGAASLDYLRHLDIDYVKIDGRYIQKLVAGTRDAVILGHVVGLCHDLGIGTIAEMIETKKAADVCAGLGVHLGQGWLYSRPLPAPRWDAVPRRTKPDPDRYLW